MGVYVKDMQMPTGHEVVYIFSDGTVKKAFLGTREALETSKAIPVPDHGRLGDLEALAEDVEIFADENAIGKIEKEELLEMVRYAPTIIPADHTDKDEQT